MILSAQSIRSRSGMIFPLLERTVYEGMTFGLGPAGYDVRIAEDLYLRNGYFCLASTIERFDVPDDIMVKLHDKSSWARRGLFVQNTVFEPGWRGYATLELTYHGRAPLALKAGMPIAQAVFHRLDEPTVQPYGESKYQDQAPGPVEAIHERSRQPSSVSENSQTS
jgi:dCTP deaminase